MYINIKKNILNKQNLKNIDNNNDIVVVILVFTSIVFLVFLNY